MTLIFTLRQAEIFSELTPTHLELIGSIAVERAYDQGAIIFEESTRGSELYVIVSGEVEIQVDSAVIGQPSQTGAHTIATLRRGQSFGEVALVDEGVRSARARSGTDDTQVIIIPRDKLIKICEAYPEMGYRLMRNLAADLAMKIRNTDLTVREYMVWMQASRRDE